MLRKLKHYNKNQKNKMNKELIKALISNLSTTAFLLSNLLTELDGAEVEQPAVKVKPSLKVGLRNTLETDIEVIEPSYVVNYVNEKFGVDVAVHNRKKEVVKARLISYYLLRKYSRLSLNDIGKEIGGRDHSTALYGLNKVKNYMMEDPNYKNYLSSISKELVSKFNNRQAA